MQTIDFKNAYYIKLGSGGKWEASSIKEDKVRIGWADMTVEEINLGNWDTLKEKYQHRLKKIK